MVQHEERPHVRVARSPEMQEADRLASVLEDSTGHIDELALESGLATWLAAHPEYAPLGTRARQIKEQWKRARKVRFGGSGVRQSTFFQPDAILILGEAGIVRMGKCNRDEWDKWWNIQLQEKLDQDAAHLEKAKYQQSRRASWDTTRYPTMQDLEEKVFGWTESVDDDQDDDGDADDD